MGKHTKHRTISKVYEHKTPVAFATAAEALDVLSGSSHSLWTAPGARAIWKALGMKGECTLHKNLVDSTEFKGLNYCEGDKGEALPDGTVVLGIAGHALASNICFALDLKVERYMGRGFQHRACMEVLRAHFKVGEAQPTKA